MVCIYCKAKTRVVNSRLQLKTNTVWRRRHCPKCKSTFTSIEAIQDLFVINPTRGPKPNTLQPFSRDKLFLSVYSSCGHRKRALADATELTNTVHNKLLSLIENGSLEKNAIIATVYSVLGHFDQTAAMYYKAYYMKDL